MASSTPIGSSSPTGHHLRPIRADDVAIDYPAVSGLARAAVGEVRRRRGAGRRRRMTYEQDREDLARHEAEIAAHETFNYAVLDAARDRAAGLRLHRPARVRTSQGADAVVSWWVVDECRRHRAGAGARRPRARAGWPRPGASRAVEYFP